MQASLMRSSSLTESNPSQLWLEMTRHTLPDSQPSRLGVNLPRSLKCGFKDRAVHAFPSFATPCRTPLNFIDISEMWTITGQCPWHIGDQQYRSLADFDKLRWGFAAARVLSVRHHAVRVLGLIAENSFDLSEAFHYYFSNEN